MKQLYLKCLFLGILSLMGITANAYNCIVNNIFYNLDTSAKTASVTYMDLTNLNKGAYRGSVTIPSSFTYSGTTYSVTSIEGRAFAWCSGLTSVVIPNSVTNIGGSLFNNCSSLTSIVVSGDNSVYDSRNNCNAIIETATNTLIAGCKSTTIPNSVTSIKGSAFSNCSGLTSVVIPSSVTSIGQSAFWSCSGLTSIVVDSGNPVYDSRNNCNAIIETASNALIAGCKSTKIPSGVTSIGDYAFFGCTTGLTSVNIPNSVTSIGKQAFYYCTGLTSVTIPNSVTSIGYWAFQQCSNLTSVTVEMTTPFTFGSDAFNNISNSCKLYVPAKTKSSYIEKGWTTDVFKGGIYEKDTFTYTYDGKTLTYKITNTTYGYVQVGDGTNAAIDTSESGAVNIPNSISYLGQTYKVVGIAPHAFEDCSGLTSVVIPSSVTSIGQSAFWSCSGLTSIVVDSGNPVYDSRNNCNAIIETASNALIAGCKSTKIPSGVTSIGNYAFFDCSGLTSVNIPNSVTSIGQQAFYGCNDLTSVTIGNSVISIGYYAFYGCTGLTEVTINSNSIVSSNRTSTTSLSTVFGNQVKSYVIGNSVTTIGNNAFYGCTGMTSVTIGNSVTSIGMDAFSGCSSLSAVLINNQDNWLGISFDNATANPLYNAHNLYLYIEFDFMDKIKIPLSDFNVSENVTSIKDYAFVGFSGMTDIMISNSVTNIGNHAFQGCSGLTSVTIPNSVTSLGSSAFQDCSGLGSVTIGNSVTNIGDNTFSGCTGLTEVTINSNSIVSSNRTSSTSLSTVFGNQVKSYVIGNSVTSIGKQAFYGCSGLTSITIPNSVTSIGSSAFSSCSGLTSITIPNTVTSIGSSAFQGCNGLKKVIVKDIAAWCNVYFSNDYSNPLYYAHHLFSDDNTEITKLIIPNSVTSIGNYTFYGCTGMTSVTIPNSVTSIGNSAFRNCSGLTSVTIGNSVTYIGDYAFSGSNAKLYVNKGTKSLITLWNKSFTAYDIESGVILPQPYISLISATQTSVTVTIENYYEGYTYTINELTINKGEKKTYSGMRPDESKYLTLRVALDDISYSKGQSFNSIGLNMKIYTTTTSSSISIVGNYFHGDATVTKEEIYVGGKKVFDDNKGVICGLDPNTAYTIYYYTNFGSVSETVRTAPLTLTTSQPKVISAGNVIVAAESNLDDEETNVGFEWRRIDWTDDFASNKGTAYLYNGTMEGYIRNLYTEKLWKYRPYYTSNAGNSYYGEWVGIDPTNTSYFEPTVHTYANVSVNGNSAEVKGYVQRGTDNVVSKGFAYWKQSQGVKSREAMSAPSMISSLPSNAKTIEVSGSQQVMTASLSNLEYETTYCYVAFVRTSEGDTFYGEEMTFTSGESPYTLGDVNSDKNIDISDVVAMVNYILGNTSSTSFKPQAADINKDGNIDISDVVALVNMILGQ